jgi:primosomal protein N' (replication factor Y)
MHYYEVAPNRIIRSSAATFTYSSNQPLSIGQLVSIEVGKKLLTGVVMQKVGRPAYVTKEIVSILEISPLPEPLIALALWISTYYDTHLAIVLQTLLPRGVAKNRRARPASPHETIRDRTQSILTADQLSALQVIQTMTPGSALLHGVTGSGKTRVYIEAAKQTLAHNRSIIVLVPEIALTSQLVDEFRGHFENIIITHSKQTEAERHLAWLASLTATAPQVVIGPRSALFMPLTNIGLIVIDEAHEPSFKQEQSPRYSALRAASILARGHQAKLIIGSATPLVSDYYLAKHSGRPIMHLPTPARAAAIKPTINLIDMTKRAGFKQHRFLSDSLLTEMRTTLDEGHQVLLFHNRRGSASTTLCENCGWTAMCARCHVPLTLHADSHQLECHICGIREQVPTSCPECGAADIIHKGIGIKLIETEIKKLFPHHTTARFDSDSSVADSVEKRYKELYDGAINIIIGTQVIAKGLDLPRLRMVGVIQADAGLSLPDYGASERTFQLLTQAIGRVGRSHHPTSVVVQSYQPSHPSIVFGLSQDYENFYKKTLHERRQAVFPPFCYLLKLTCVYKTEKAAAANAKQLASVLKRQLQPTTTLLGPTPAFYERSGDTYRWQLVVKSPRRADLVDLLQYLPEVHWQYELDPISLL